LLGLLLLFSAAGFSVAGFEAASVVLAAPLVLPLLSVLEGVVLDPEVSLELSVLGALPDFA